jgi:hypothetical protein
VWCSSLFCCLYVSDLISNISCKALCEGARLSSWQLIGVVAATRVSVVLSTATQSTRVVASQGSCQPTRLLISAQLLTWWNVRCSVVSAVHWLLSPRADAADLL